MYSLSLWRLRGTAVGGPLRDLPSLVHAKTKKRLSGGEVTPKTVLVARVTAAEWDRSLWITSCAAEPFETVAQSHHAVPVSQEGRHRLLLLYRDPPAPVVLVYSAQLRSVNKCQRVYAVLKRGWDKEKLKPSFVAVKLHIAICAMCQDREFRDPVCDLPLILLLFQK